MDGDPHNGPARTTTVSGQLQVRAAMLTDKGCVRSSNEDRVLYTIPDAGKADAALGTLALVADGMGGHAAGEVASAIAATTIHYLYYRQKRPTPEALAEAFAAANLAIHERSKSDPACNGMGTTCTAIVVRDSHIWLGHVGDSRAYLIRRGKLYRISEDHSLVAEMVKQGALTEQEARTFPDRNVILKALGIRPEVEPMIWGEGLPGRAGDVLVLCSDGLSDVLEDEQIRQLALSGPPFEAAQALLDAALAAKASDNVSVGVIALEAGETPATKVGRTTQETVRP